MEDPYPVENVKKLCLFMFQTWDNNQLCTDSQCSSQLLTIVSSFKHKNTQPLYIFNRENPQNSEPHNVPRRGLDFIALVQTSPKEFLVFKHEMGNLWNLSLGIDILSVLFWVRIILNYSQKNNIWVGNWNNFRAWCTLAMFGVSL